MKSRTILLALGVCLLSLSSLASADNLPLGEEVIGGAVSIPSTAFTYQGVQPDPAYCCSVDPAVNPLVPYTFWFEVVPIDTGDPSPGLLEWYVTVEGYAYSYDPKDPTVAYLMADGGALNEFENALFGGATEYEVGPDNYIVPVTPEPGSLVLLFIGLCFLAIIRSRHSARIDTSDQHRS